MRPIDFLDLGARARTPLIQQNEASECGLACLAMVAGYHGYLIDLPMLRQRFSVSLKGATLKALMDIGEQIGFSSRPLRCEMDDLAQLSLPAILHWDLTHFVVLTKITRRAGGRVYHIHDPDKGSHALKEQEFSSHFTGVVLELTKAETFEARAERSPLRINQMWSKLTGLWSSLRNVLLLSVILQVIALAAPFYLQLAVDTVVPSFDADLLKMLALGFGGLVLITMVTSWLRTQLLLTLGAALSYQVITNLYRHLLRLPLPWFEKRHVGDILSRFSSTKPISDLLSQGLIASLLDGLMALLTLALMFVYSPLLAGIAAVTCVAYGAVRVAFFQSLRLRNIDAITAAARESSSFIESIRGIAALKAFGQESNRQLRWQQQKATAVNAEIKLGRMKAGFDVAGQSILGLERIIFVYAAITLAMKGDFTVGMIFAFQAYKQQFLDATTRLVEHAMNYKLLDVHLTRLSDIALSSAEDPGAPSGTNGRPATGAIELRQVRFRYGVGEPEVLGGVNLKIEPGQLVALIGPSGGGKTTLAKIMMGLFDPSTGVVLIDGQPLSHFGKQSWRKQIGSVAQDDELFAGTLAENIAFFDSEICMERVWEVAQIAQIHDEIDRFPLRYDTLVGDMGSALSGGQKQRVLLARALYGRPKVLFIDEGTAHLDPKLEERVVGALDDLGITRIVIAHRPQAAASASRLFLVARGTCREMEKVTQSNDLALELA